MPHQDTCRRAAHNRTGWEGGEAKEGKRLGGAWFENSTSGGDEGGRGPLHAQPQHLRGNGRVCGALGDVAEIAELGSSLGARQSVRETRCTRALSMLEASARRACRVANLISDLGAAVRPFWM